MGHRRTAESEDEMDRMIAALVTAQSPKGLARWASRQRRRLPEAERTDEEKVAARDRTLALLGAQFGIRVKVS